MRGVKASALPYILNSIAKIEMRGNTLHWGICCAGKISHDFVVALQTLPPEEHNVTAIAASTLERASKFAKLHSISRTYGTYEKLAEDPEVDVVYVGSGTAKHYELTKMFLDYGKPVLCEKPLCMHVEQVKTLVNLAKRNNVFLMEAIWSRCLPAYREIEKIVKKGLIGEVKSIQTAFGDNVTDVNAKQRLHRKELGGGAVFDVGIYQIQLCQLIFKEKPKSQTSVGFLNEDGVDVMSNTIITYSNDRIGSMATSIVCEYSNDASVCGTAGFIRIHAPFWCPTAITVNGKTKEFPFPKASMPLNFRNSTGLRYEAQEVRRCLMENLIESCRITHEMSIEIAEIIEKAIKDLGYVI